MLFKTRFHDGLRAGRITLTFRDWSRPQVKVGGTYRVGRELELSVRSVDRVSLSAISDEDAVCAGFQGREDLLAFLEKAGTSGNDELVYRVVFDARVSPAQSPPSSELPAAELDALATRLERLDRLSRHGRWVGPTLRLIADNPRRRAGDLAATAGRETLGFKVDVRKLKRLGLTRSHEVGYEITPRGQQVSRHLAMGAREEDR